MTMILDSVAAILLWLLSFVAAWVVSFICAAVLLSLGPLIWMILVPFVWFDQYAFQIGVQIFFSLTLVFSIPVSAILSIVSEWRGIQPQHGLYALAGAVIAVTPIAVVFGIYGFQGLFMSIRLAFLFGISLALGGVMMAHLRKLWYRRKDQPA